MKGEEVLLKVEGLKKWYGMGEGFLSSLLKSSQETRYVRAVDGVSFELYTGEILGLAGESGSGKSTLGEVLVGLQGATDGELEFKGKPVDYKNLGKAFRRQVQMVFQDVYGTLNPRLTVYESVAEPLLVAGLSDKDELRRRVTDALELSELRPGHSYLNTYPHQLSGGQRQRVAIARAIAIKPAFVVADEPVSMLDVSVRSGVLNLLQNLRETMGLSMVFVSHDLSTIRYLCDRTAIMYLGRFAEIGPTEPTIMKPLHPYAKALAMAVPVPDPEFGRPRVQVKGEVPDPIDLPPGCRFAPRCPERVARCLEVEPELKPVGEEGRQVACHMVQ